MEIDHDFEIIKPDNAENVLTIGGSGALIVPVGNTVQRATPVNGMVRYNADINQIEWVLNGAYRSADVAGNLLSNSTTINISLATAPVAGQVLTATSDSSATWQTPTGGGSGSQAQILRIASLRV